MEARNAFTTRNYRHIMVMIMRGAEYTAIRLLANRDGEDTEIARGLASSPSIISIGVPNRISGKASLFAPNSQALASEVGGMVVWLVCLPMVIVDSLTLSSCVEALGWLVWG